MSSESDKKTLSLVALGPGCENLLTYQAESEIKDADIIFGAERVLKTVHNIKSENSDTEKLYEAEKIAQYLKNNEKYKRAVVCFSGDVGFFSGAQAFYEKTQSLFSDWKVSVFPGVSSVQYFASKLGRAWQNWNFLSLHGSKCNFIEEIRKNELNFLILSGKKDLEVIRKKLDTARKNGLLSDFNCYIGLNLSYDVEKIGQFESFNDSESSLFVLLIENSSAKVNSVLPVLNDSDFLRAEKIPITKKEVRQLSVCSLGLSEKSVLYDIGCGSGSVSVEAARIALKGRVISIDCNEDAVLLTQKNAERFCLENIECIHNEALSFLKEAEYPLPTHAFIGGSRGNLYEIIRLLLEKNPEIKITANFISLENLCEMQKVLKEFESKISEPEIKQISVNKAEKIGDFNLMKAQNPVWIVSFKGKAGDEYTK